MKNLEVEIDWEEFKKFCEINSKNEKHIKNLVNYAKKYGFLLFSSPLDFALTIKSLEEKKKTLKRHVLQSLAALSKYLDLKYETERYYTRFIELRKKAGITWGETKQPKIMLRPLSLEDVLKKILSVKSKKLKSTLLLQLITGLRTEEVIRLVKEYDKLEKTEIKNSILITLNFIRKTKKAFITILHKKLIFLIKLAHKNKKSYWKNAKKHGLKPYDMRRLFESLYTNLRSHEIDLLQGRLSTELVIHYTRDIEKIVEKVEIVQEKIIEELKKCEHFLEFLQ